VRTVAKGIRRVKGTTQRQAAPAVVDVMRQMVRQLPDSLSGQRDRALLLLGFAGAFRRSELVSLTVADVRFTGEGLVVQLKKSKTDQEGEDTRKGIPLGTWPETCPVRALKAWLKAARITEGPIFRPVDRHGHIGAQALSGGAVSAIVKKWAGKAGFDEGEFSGHSLRAGLATSAASMGVSDRAIAKQTGHKSRRVLERYIREGQLFRDNAAGSVGL
jgi:integrase